MKRIILHPFNTIAPGRQLAIDEALLMEGRDRLRLWNFDRTTVVLGRSSRVDDEVDRDFCSRSDIEVLRRCSGGASIVGGPGCMMYSVVLSLESYPHLAKIDAAHSEVMGRVAAAVSKQVDGVRVQGICDLTVNDRKCGGNALRVTRDAVLYHGTILYDFDLTLVARCLRHAPRQPEYRNQRSHQQFVVNVPLDRSRLEEDFAAQFDVCGDIRWDASSSTVETLMLQRYDAASWHLRH